MCQTANDHRSIEAHTAQFRWNFMGKIQFHCVRATSNADFNGILFYFAIPSVHRRPLAVCVCACSMFMSVCRVLLSLTPAYAAAAVWRISARKYAN